MMFLLIAATIPIVFICTIIYIKDTEKEPIKPLIKSFLWGMGIVVPILIIELILSEVIDGTLDIGHLHNFFTAFMIAAGVEEGFKYLATKRFLSRSKHYDQFYDGIVYAVFVSLGFALVENILFVVNNDVYTAIIRGLLTVPGHALWGVFMGYYLSHAFLGDPKKRRVNLRMALFIPILLHGLFDFFLFETDTWVEVYPGLVVLYMLTFFLLNFLMWRHGLRRIRRHIKEDNRQEAPFDNRDFV